MELVATKLGWVNVETGELVQRIFGLSGARNWDPETNTFDPPLASVKETKAEPDPAPAETEPTKQEKKPAKKKKNKGE